MNLWPIFVILFAILIIAHIIEYKLEKKRWNNVVCNKCNIPWVWAGGTGYRCTKCEQITYFTYDWDCQIQKNKK